MGNFFEDLFGKPSDSERSAAQAAVTSPEAPTNYEVPREYLDALNSISSQMGSYSDQMAAQANKMGDIAEGYYNQTASVRDPVITRLANFMAGDLDPYASIQWQYGKSALEDQYEAAKKSTLAGLPAGGVLHSALAGLETQKAKGALDVVNKIVNDEYNKAYGLATSSPTTALSGLSSSLSGLGSSASVLGASASPINSILSALGSANNYNLARDAQYKAQQQYYAQLVAQQQAAANQSMGNLAKGLGYLFSGKGGD